MDVATFEIMLALELHALLGTRKVRPLERNDAQRMRQRAFTLLVKPSLFVKKRRPTTSSQPERPVTAEPVVRVPTPIRVVTELAPTG